MHMGSLLRNHSIDTPPSPHGKVQACACTFESYLFALQRVNCKTLSENMLLESLLKNGGLKPERSCFTALLS